MVQGKTTEIHDTYSCEYEILDDFVPPTKGLPNARATVERIERYLNSGASGTAKFDVRVSAALHALDKSIANISDTAPGIGEDENGDDNYTARDVAHPCILFKTVTQLPHPLANVASYSSWPWTASHGHTRP